MVCNWICIMISAVITPHHIMIDKRGSLSLKTNLLSVFGVCRDGILRAVKILVDEFLQIVEGLVGCKFDEMVHYQFYKF